MGQIDSGEAGWTTIHTAGQWQIQVEAGGAAYRVVNPAADGTLQYYLAKSGQYGQPLLVAEPDLSIACPARCCYIKRDGSGAKPMEKIAGLICKDENGQVVLRMSLTNAKNKGVEWVLDEEGGLTVDGKTFHLYALVGKDKNRIVNYDAFFSTTARSGVVEVLELEDLV